MDMEGWFRDLNATDREPMLTRDEVAQKWGVDFGPLVGQVILPGRESVVHDPEDPEVVRDQARRTLMIFDARGSKHAAPHYVVASYTGLSAARQHRPWSGSNQDIQHIYEGENLRVGAGQGQWLPEAIHRQEKNIKRAGKDGHSTRRVISDEQTLFYIADDGELHVRSVGYNADTFIGYPNATERMHRVRTKEYESRMRQEIATARAARAAELAVANTASLASPIASTEYFSRHATGAKLTRTISVAHR